MERAFFHYDADLSGYLDYDEIVPALRVTWVQARCLLLFRSCSVSVTLWSCTKPPDGRLRS